MYYNVTAISYLLLIIANSLPAVIVYLYVFAVFMNTTIDASTVTTATITSTASTTTIITSNVTPSYSTTTIPAVTDTHSSTTSLN